jgi:hypothetical protein
MDVMARWQTFVEDDLHAVSCLLYAPWVADTHGRLLRK